MADAHGWLLGGVVATVGYAVFQGWVNWPTRYDRKALCAVLELLHGQMAFPPAHNVCSTLWVPDRVVDPQWVRQVAKCPTNGPQSETTRLPVTKGIVGKVFRLGTYRVETLTGDGYNSPDYFRDTMVREYSFTHNEAKKLNSNARAYMGVPIIDGGKVVGVVFFDSSDVAAFSDETAQKAQGLAPFFCQLLRLRGE